MAKYRIIEEGEKFYPQEKKNILSHWKFLDNYWASNTWFSDKDECRCHSMEEAIKVIEKRINFKEKAKKVVYKYPLSEQTYGGNND